jgi:multidrug efflux pump subunit AcrA (membrane-fusion protein)
VQLRPINIGRDYGTTLEILGGVLPTDQIVVNPADSLEDGQPVNLAQPQPQPGQAQPAQPKGGAS